MVLGVVLGVVLVDAVVVLVVLGLVVLVDAVVVPVVLGTSVLATKLSVPRLRPAAANLNLLGASVCVVFVIQNAE